MFKIDKNPDFNKQEGHDGPSSLTLITMYCNVKYIKTIILNATSTVLTRFFFIWPSDLYFFTGYDPYSNMD